MESSNTEDVLASLYVHITSFHKCIVVCLIFITQVLFFFKSHCGNGSKEK